MISTNEKPGTVHPPFGPETLRVEYKIQVTSTEGIFMTWAGLFDLPGALVPEHCHDNVKLYELFSLELIQKGSHSRFQNLLTRRYSDHLRATMEAEDAAQERSNDHPLAPAPASGEPVHPPPKVRLEKPEAGCKNPDVWAAYQQQCEDLKWEEMLRSVGSGENLPPTGTRPPVAAPRPAVAAKAEPKCPPAPADVPPMLRNLPPHLAADLGIAPEPSEAQMSQARQVARKKVQAAADSLEVKKPTPAPVFVAAPLQQAA